MKRIFFAAVLIALAGAAFAAVNPSAEIMFPILDIGVGARACALAGAFSAGADDASAVFWNPAGLGGVKAAEIAMTYDAWFMNSFYGHVLAAVPAGPGTIAADIIYLNGGEFPDMDQYGIPTGTNTSAMSIGGLLSYGMEIAGGFSAGLTAKVLSQSIGASSGLGLGADIGVMFETGMIKLGVNARNIGTAGSYSMPMSINGGVKMTPLNTQQHSLSIELDGKYLFNDAPSAIAGAEYIFSKMFSIRAGYAYRIGEDNLSGLAGVTAGIGFNLAGLKMDYAFVPYGDLGTSHRATLSYLFGKSAAYVPAAKKEGKIKDVSAAVAEADRYEKDGNLAKAQAALRDAVIDAPENADLWKKLGTLYYKDRKKENAVKAFEIYMKLVPTDSKTKAWLEKYRK